MKTVYEAANAIEAHMICHLLKQEHIGAQVLGEHLQGAMGELPAAGLVRVVVDESDWPLARAAIGRWEATQDDTHPSPPAAERPRSGARVALAAVLGLSLGVAAGAAYFRAPVTDEGIDFNRDGVVDERWFFAPSGRATHVETDRNLDGRVDRIDRFDTAGHAASAELDDDFDGRFETRVTHRRGQYEFVHTDTDGDGHVDLIEHHAHGVLSTRRVIERGSERVLREDTLRFGRIVHADVDTDGDGTLDTRLRYTPLGEVASREALPR